MPFRLQFAVILFAIGTALHNFLINFVLKALGSPVSHLGIYHALVMLVPLLAGPWVGQWSQRWGHHRCLLGAMGLYLTITSVYALFPSPAIILILCGLQGFATVFYTTNLIPLVFESQVTNRGLHALSRNSGAIGLSGFLGTLLGGQAADTLGSLNTLWIAPMFSLLAIALAWNRDSIPLNSNRPRSPAETPRSPWETLKAFKSLFQKYMPLIAPEVIIGIGAGLSIPFLNVYIQRKTGLSISNIGWIFGIGTGLTGLMFFAQPQLSRLINNPVIFVICSRAGSLTFLLFLSLSTTPWVLGVSIVFRDMFMNMVDPVLNAFYMKKIKEKSTFLLMKHSLWGLGWAMGTTFSGYARVVLPLEALLLTTAFCYAMALGWMLHHTLTKHPLYTLDGTSDR